jgi:hypothetical protein
MIILRKGIVRHRTRAKREFYKGRVVQGQARQTATGRWQPIIYIQLGAGMTDSVSIQIPETFGTAAEAKGCSVFRAKQLIDSGGLGPIGKVKEPVRKPSAPPSDKLGR